MENSIEKWVEDLKQKVPSIDWGLNEEVVEELRTAFEEKDK